MSNLSRTLVGLVCAAMGGLAGYWLGGLLAANFEPANREGIRLYLGVPLGIAVGLFAGVWINRCNRPPAGPFG